MREKFDKITDELQDIKKENELFRETLLQEDREQKNKTESMQKEIDNLKDEKINLNIRITQLEKAIERDEKQKRKENIIIKGSKFRQENLIEDITHYIKEKLEIEVEITEAYPIGKGENRNILAKLKNFNQKLNVLKNKKKLQNENIYIQSDLTKHEKEVQNILRDIAKENREKGNSVRIGYFYLIINKVRYDWDDIAQNLIEHKQKK